MTDVVRIVLVNDQPLVSAGVGIIVASEPGLEVVAEAANGELGAHAALVHRPDVVLMDVRMPVMDGLEATARIRTADGPPVQILTTFDDDDVLWSAVEAGAAGLVLKDAPGDEIAGSYAANPAPQLRMIKELLTANASEGDLLAVQRSEHRYLAECWASPQHAEAVQAFMEKRAPVFIR